MLTSGHPKYVSARRHIGPFGLTESGTGGRENRPTRGAAGGDIPNNISDTGG